MANCVGPIGASGGRVGGGRAEVESKAGGRPYTVVEAVNLMLAEIAKGPAKSPEPEPLVDLVDLGWLNSEGPKLRAARAFCLAAGHRTTETTIGRCLTRVKCLACGYTYQVDSSD